MSQAWFFTRKDRQRYRKDNAAGRFETSSNSECNHEDDRQRKSEIFFVYNVWV